jgi:hypothetical protein
MKGLLNWIKIRGIRWEVDKASTCVISFVKVLCTEIRLSVTYHTLLLQSVEPLRHGGCMHYREQQHYMVQGMELTSGPKEYEHSTKVWENTY